MLIIMDHIAEDYANMSEVFLRTGREMAGKDFNRKHDEEEEDYNTKREDELYGTGNVSYRIFSNLKAYQHEEYQYLNILENILENGFWEEGRNGKTKSIFGQSMRFSLKDGQIPILTTKKTAWKTSLKELLWFIRGETDNKILKQQGVHIWDANGSKNFWIQEVLQNMM